MGWWRRQQQADSFAAHTCVRAEPSAVPAAATRPGTSWFFRAVAASLCFIYLFGAVQAGWLVLDLVWPEVAEQLASDSSVGGCAGGPICACCKGKGVCHCSMMMHMHADSADRGRSRDEATAAAAARLTAALHFDSIAENAASTENPDTAARQQCASTSPRVPSAPQISPDAMTHLEHLAAKVTEPVLSVAHARQPGGWPATRGQRPASIPTNPPDKVPLA